MPKKHDPKKKREKMACPSSMTKKRERKEKRKKMDTPMSMKKSIYVYMSVISSTNEAQDPVSS